MILITGGTGQVGRSLRAHDSARSLCFVAPLRTELDLSNAQSIRDYLDAHSFTAVINAGAYTAVDQAESEPELAMAINGHAPALLAEYCKARNIPLIHISTDYVFSGDKSLPYDESDVTSPLGVYGRTKLKGEEAVIASGCNSVILRTAWVVSRYGKNFIKSMLRLAKERDEIRVVNDQYGCPTGAQDLADVVLSILPRLITGEARLQGVYNCTNSGNATWADLARVVMSTSAKMDGPSASIINIATADYPTPAKRPKNSRLICEKLKQNFDIEMRPWQGMVEDIVAVLLDQEGRAL